ncbi:MAG: tRNA (adenosine(37)-N6)-threonylcarbamoyltransferase complex dimerization subunit type 1 TsaB [Fervidobacterium sp.]|uniref:tRNA (adenosine(37)-N6)-threonylcarbamoyltransferase complex dimerization subunit type 1 TsaB n=1 Tax=Fervidobacterium TaxID=2422 RepID=UPI002206E607|nr:peptidase M22 [Fervidobacterium riparium]
MKIFALDTSTPRVVACYVDDEKKIFVELETKAKHGIQVSQVVEKMAEVDFANLNIVGIGIGPGGLTGLRVGISFAYGLGIGNKFVQISSLKLIALNGLFYNGYIAVVRKAREGYLYSALYKPENGKLDEIVSPFIETVDLINERYREFSPKLFLGDGAEFFESDVKLNKFELSELSLPTARNLYLLACEEIENERFVNDIEPLYLQKSIAELNFEKRKKEGSV